MKPDLLLLFLIRVIRVNPGQILAVYRCCLPGSAALTGVADCGCADRRFASHRLASHRAFRIQQVLVIRAQSKFDQGARIGSGLGLPIVVSLITLHRLLGRVIPHASRLACQVMLANQSFLNFQRTLRVYLLLSARMTGRRSSRLLSLVSSGVRCRGGCRRLFCRSG